KKYLKRKDIKKSFLDLVNADGRILPFRNNIFNGIICIAVLHNIPGKRDRRRFLRECKRVLLKGKHIILTVWTLFQPKILLKIFLHKLQYNGEFGDVYIPWKRRGKKIYRFYHLYRKKELKKDLESAGFTIHLLKKYDHRKFLKRNYLIIASY
ncbi:MAG TPA: class I SAM-dependent methyltransferase, partial [Thermoprotei archaeon]|nr:class I SAM-dependent methyltransferase [Thermoprotei archaeon]